MSEADVTAAVDAYAGAYIRDDGQMHNEACPGVLAIECSCVAARAAVERALALTVAGVQAAMPCYEARRRVGIAACWTSSRRAKCPSCKAKVEVERLKAERETVGAP